MKENVPRQENGWKLAECARGGGDLDSLLHFIFLHLSLLIEASTERGEGTAGEENNPLELLVEKEVVEAPDGSILPEWIGHEVWVVGVDVALHQVDLAVQSQPQLVVNFAVLGGRGDAQQVVNVVCDELEINCQHSKIKYK